MGHATSFLAELTWAEFGEAAAKGTPVLLPVGSTEQHGVHLPLNTDQLLPTEVCRRVTALRQALVAPTICYGYKSQQRAGGGNWYPGTLSLDGGTLTALVKTVLTELGRHGIRQMCLVNGHYENLWFLHEAVDLALRELKWDGVRDARIVLLSYWDFISPETIARIGDYELYRYEDALPFAHVVRGADEIKRRAELRLALAERLFLQGQNDVEIAPEALQEVAHPGERQSEPLERQDGGQAFSIRAAIGAPALGRTERLQQPLAFVDAQRLDRHAEAGGEIGGGVSRAGHGSPSCVPVGGTHRGMEPDPGSGARPIASRCDARRGVRPGGGCGPGAPV